MAGIMYLGNQKVTPVIVQGGGSSETPTTLFKLADDMVESPTREQQSVHLPEFFPIEIDLNNLEVISSPYLFYYVAPNNSHVSIKATKIRVISGTAALGEAFSSSSFDEFDFDFSSIEEISGSSSCESMFYLSKNVPSTIRFENLSILTGNRAFALCFCLCTFDGDYPEIYFNSLTSQSFGSNTNQFKSMIYGVSDCTIHFPSNLESVIGDWDDVLSGFGGTNTTVLFDLEAKS